MPVDNSFTIVCLAKSSVKEERYIVVVVVVLPLMSPLILYVIHVNFKYGLSSSSNSTDDNTLSYINSLTFISAILLLSYIKCN
jgi:hypothetical protein